MTHLRFACCAWLAVATLAGASLEILPEYRRPDPFGGILAADATARPAGFETRVTLETARANYVSCHLVAKLPAGGSYALRLEPEAGSPLAPELFREWFHLRESDKAYYPDALIPVRSPYQSRMPEPDNRIAKQTAQSFWLDVWVPAAVTPEEDAVTIDHNSYGAAWLGDYFPSVRAQEGAKFLESDAYFGLIHAYHRIFFEHRGILHQLGYGHGGKVAPEFAPALAGTGRTRRIASWDLYDRHYGPLLDGSAFAGGRRKTRPLPFVYLPINPEWPAQFVN